MSDAKVTADQVDRWLREIQRGEEARRELTEAVYGEIRRIAHGKRAAHGGDTTMCTTALANEVYMRIARDQLFESAPNHRYFFVAVANAAYRTLVDYARQRIAKKRGGSLEPQDLATAENELLERSLTTLKAQANWELTDRLDSALAKLGRDRPRQHEIVMLFYFGGYTMSEIAEKLECSESTIKADLKKARLWLAAELEEGNDTQ